MKPIFVLPMLLVVLAASAFAGSDNSATDAPSNVISAPIAPFIAAKPAVSSESQPYRSLSPMGKLARFGRSAYSPRVFTAGALTAGMPNLPEKVTRPADLGANATKAQIAQYEIAMQDYETRSTAYQREIQEEVRFRMRGFISGVAEAETRNLLGEFLLPVIFRQDPRYIPSTGAHGRGYRLAYAVSRVVVGRSDSGQRMINYSKLGATVGSATAARYYYEPALNLPRLQTNAHMMKSIGANLAFDMLVNIWHEFHGSRRPH